MNYMGHLTKIFITLSVLCFTLLPSFSALKGGVDYSIPIDYSKLNPEELEAKAEFYYNAALGSNEMNDNMTSALNLYTILTNISPDNIRYALRLGKLYDILGKDRYAKGKYYQAMGINPKSPEPYFYLGDFFYEREQYRKALKFYKRAYDNGYSNHSQTLIKMEDIYKRFGDTKNAKKYSLAEDG